LLVSQAVINACRCSCTALLVAALHQSTTGTGSRGGGGVTCDSTGFGKLVCGFQSLVKAAAALQTGWLQMSAIATATATATTHALLQKTCSAVWSQTFDCLHACVTALPSSVKAQAPQLLPKDYIPLIRARSTKPCSATASASTRKTLTFSAEERRQCMRRHWQWQRQRQERKGVNHDSEIWVLRVGNIVQTQSQGAPISMPERAINTSKRLRDE
jgi:hypothetical protein